MSQAGRALSLFISYSHKDDAMREKLDTHLALLKRQRVFDIWHDRRIAGGREWANAIDEALEKADVILLLVSADFLASDYCYDKELNRAMQRHEAGSARVVPVILRACDWQTSVFGKLQAFPRDGLPVERHPQGADVALTEVAKSLRIIADDLRGVPGSIVSSPVLRSGQLPATEPEAPVTPANPVAPTRKLKIGAVKLGPLEVGPFEIDWPIRLGRGAVRLALGGGVLILLACSVPYLFVLRPALRDARDAMRLGDYPSAKERLELLPKWAAWWPESRSLRDQARFGAQLSSEKGIPALPRELATLASRYPGAPDVLVFQGLDHFYAGDFVKAIQAFSSAASADPLHAEAHFLAAGLRQELASQSLARGDAASARKEYAEARDLMDQAMKRSPVVPKMKRYASQVAALLESMGDAPGAYQAYSHLAARDAMSAVQAAMISWRLPDSIVEVRDGKDAAQAQSAKLGANPKEAVDGWMFGIPARGPVIVSTPRDQRCLADWVVAISDAIIEAHAVGQHAVASAQAKSPSPRTGGAVGPRRPSQPQSCSDTPGMVREVVCIKILAAQQVLPPAHPRIQELEAWKKAAPACDPDLKPPVVLPPLEGQRLAGRTD